MLADVATPPPAVPCMIARRKALRAYTSGSSVGTAYISGSVFSQVIYPGNDRPTLSFVSEYEYMTSPVCVCG